MRIGGGLLLATFAFLLSAAPVATAERPQPKRFEVRERRLDMLLLTKGGDGYRASIATSGHRRVTLTISKGKTEVEARTSGQVTSQRIEADFGDLGRISLRFRPGGLRAVARSECRGRPRVLEAGTFQGTIRFEGDALPRLDVKRAWGLVRRRYRQICPAGAKSNPFRAALEKLLGRVRLTMLRSHARLGNATVLFEAKAADLSPLFGGAPNYESIFSARLLEHRDGVRLTRSVGADGYEGSFLFSEKGAKPQTATVTPPGKPFSGSAEYLKEEGQPAGWSGSLAAHVPGAGLVALATPRFRPDFCRLTFADLLDGSGCPLWSRQDRAETLKDLRPLLTQGSGSHSQPFAEARLSWSR